MASEVIDAVEELAEKKDFFSQLSARMVGLAIRDLAEWQRAGYPEADLQKKDKVRADYARNVMIANGKDARKWFVGESDSSLPFDFCAEMIGFDAKRAAERILENPREVEALISDDGIERLAASKRMRPAA